MSKALLHLRLERAVLGVAAWIAVHDNSITRTVVAAAILRELLERNPQRDSRRADIRVGCGLDRRPLIGNSGAGGVRWVDAKRCAIAADRSQVQLVQVSRAQRQEEAAAAYITGTQGELMG